MNGIYVNRGFTLLESVLALSILALSAGALMQTYQLSLNRIEKTVNHHRALLIVNSIADRIGFDIPANESQSGNLTENCVWNTESRTLEREVDVSAFLQRYRVELKVICGQGRSARAIETSLLSLHRG